MPELLLSSMPGKDLAPKSNLNPVDPNKGGTEGLSKESEFTHVLSSMVNQPSADENMTQEQVALQEQSPMQEVQEALQKVTAQIEQMDIELAELSELTSFLDGHDLTSQGMNEEKLGLSLPEFLNQLQAKIDALNAAMSEQENIPDNQLVELEAIMTQFTQVMSEVAVRANNQNNKEDIKPTILGFSFNSNTGNGRGDGSQWQKYDPQQLSQNGQLSPATMSDTGLLSEQLVSKTDRAFQQQMEQLVSDRKVDVNDKTFTLSDSLLDTKDRAINQFSDLQLKSTTDSLKPYSTTLSTPVNAQNWSDELSQKVVWFSGRNISAAEMHLNPAELGPIDVRINVQNDVATVTFNVNNASVKDLLESSVVRLREMMESNGVNVGEVTIDADSRGESGQQGAANHDQPGFAQNGQDESGLSDETNEQTITLKETNLVDYFV